MRKSFYRSIGLILAAAVLTAGCVGSRSRLKVGHSEEGDVVEAEGLAPNDPNDLIATKRASLTDAQRNAVEKAVGVFVSARTMVEKAMTIENNILARTEGYVKKYDVIKEWVDDGFYKTRIRALVALKDLEADLKDLSLLNTPELERPRVVISLTEKIGKDVLKNKPASSAMEKSLLDQGFTVLTEDRIKEADLVIEGSVSSFPFQTEGLGGFISYRARLTAQARRPDARDVMASVSREASGLGGNDELAGMKSLETVGDLVGDELGEKIAEEWSKGKRLVISIEGVPSFSDVDRIRTHLASQPGIKDLVLRLYEEQTAQFDVQLSSIRPEELASRLEKSKTLPLKILETSNQILRTRFKK